jgi:signal transduction histidine kinase/CheY-like chemotaxis protein
MSVDPRFRESPPVSKGGLKMYAGTQLRCQADDGEVIALGSLCVASSTLGPGLTQTQLTTLVTFADMLTQDIISASRRKRAKQQEQNDLLLRLAASSGSSDQAEQIVMDILRKVFPEAQIGLTSIGAHGARIYDHGPLVVPPKDQSAIWEDDEYINKSIRTNNHERLKASQPIRAIIAKLPERPLATALVVATNDITYIFDDIDIRFTTSCANLLTSIRQEKALQIALRARDQFMRGITHQLRTPIHGILGSLDLLIADLTAQSERDFSTLSITEDQPKSGRYHETLSIIRSSARELMSTVNNAIKYNRLTETSDITRKALPDKLNKVESDLLEAIVGYVSEGHLDRLLVFFRNRLPAEVELTMIDMASLVECLQSLVLNALQNTTRGSIAITTTASPDFSCIYFDVEDTGCGIAAADQQRIFYAYEKINVHSTGVGLGLPLACKMAEVMEGRVTLVSSESGKGSHFRVELQNPLLLCPITRPRHLDERLNIGISKFCVLAAESSSAVVEHLKSFLVSRGLQESTEISESLAVVMTANSCDEFNQLLEQASKSIMSVALIPAEMYQPSLTLVHATTLFFSGPFTSRKLEHILVQASDEVALRKAQAAKVAADAQAAQSEDGLTSRNHSCNSDGPIRPHSPKSCLLVDDNAINLRIVSMYCEKRKYPYSTAEDGLQAIDAYKTAAGGENPVDLILLDLQMPNCDGIQACQEIRAFERSTGLRPAIIFISPYKSLPLLLLQ